ncbi:MAG: type II secretion system F family protein [Candidatus Woesearchaeota archaeon]|nr:type II secretion system F family protein [Candidatus Woesearchaeota archaeon]
MSNQKMRIPYCFFPEGFVRRGASLFYWLSDFLDGLMPETEIDLKQAGMDTKSRTYIAASLFSDFILFLFIFAFILASSLKYNTKYTLAAVLIIPAAVISFIFFQQITYPKAVISQKVNGIERNLLPALRIMQVQISSGIPLYDVISAIAGGNYGGVSEQFNKVIKEINAGTHQINAFEKMAAENPSVYFQRVIWQIVTAVKSGSDLGPVLNEIVRSLSDEQIVQVQDYGSKLNPLTMFYMLLVVIVPALSVTFLVVIGSFISLSSSTLKLLFWGMYAAVLIFQLFFMSMISSNRPSMV